VESELWFQPIGFRWAHKVFQIPNARQSERPLNSNPYTEKEGEL